MLRAIETHALSLPDGSGVLVFLPGLAEIQRCRELLQRSACLETWDVVCLHGQLPLEDQRKALRGCDRHHAGQLILASAIAESSITLSGVRLVIDSGLSRQLRYDPAPEWKVSRPSHPASPAQISAVVAQVAKGQDAAFASGHRPTSNDDHGSVHPSLAWPIRNRWCWSLQHGDAAWETICPGWIRLLEQL